MSSKNGAMRVAVNDGAEVECKKVKVICTLMASGWIPVKGSISPEEPIVGEEIELTIEHVRDSPAEDNEVTIRMKKHVGRPISRKINLTELFDLVRDAKKKAKENGLTPA